MWNTIIGTHIRRSNRVLLLTNGLVVLLVLGTAALCGRYLFNFCFGPFVVDRATLLSNKEAHRSLEYFVDVHGDQAFEVGNQIEKTTNKRTGAVTRERVVAKYLALRLDDRLLFVKAPPTDTTTQYSGALEDVPADVHNQFVATLDAATRQNVFPFMLDATGFAGFRGPGYIGLALGVPLLLLGGWNVTRALQRMGNPSRHPIARRLERFGIPEEVASRLDDQAQEDQRRLGAVTLTTSWLMRPTFFGLELMHLGEVLWIYKKVTKHYTNGIPTGTTTAAVVCDANGAILEVPCGEEGTNQFLEEVYQRAPWVLAGHNEELETLWKSNRNAMLEAVEERRKQVKDMMERPTPAEAPPEPL